MDTNYHDYVLVLEDRTAVKSELEVGFYGADTFQYDTILFGITTSTPRWRIPKLKK